MTHKWVEDGWMDEAEFMRWVRACAERPNPLLEELKFVEVPEPPKDGRLYG